MWHFGDSKWELIGKAILCFVADYLLKISPPTHGHEIEKTIIVYMIFTDHYCQNVSTCYKYDATCWQTRSVMTYMLALKVSKNTVELPECKPVRLHLYGLGYPRQPSPPDNFTECLYDKKLARLTEIKLTLLNHSEILLLTSLRSFP